MGLSTVQTRAVQRLVQTVPDLLLARLDDALNLARLGDPAFDPVADLARAEIAERRVRDIVLSPLRPLAALAPPPPKHSLLKPADLARVWRLMRAVAPQEVEAAQRATAVMRSDQPPPLVLDTLCLLAGQALRETDPSPRSEAAAWPAADRLRLAKLLTMTPVLRAMLPKMPAWMRNLGMDQMAAARLAFKDATAVDGDAGPYFMEAALAHMEEPSQILRLISAVMDRPSDRYLAETELAGLGQRLLDDIDRRLQAARAFNPDRGAQGGAAEAASLLIAANAVHEFEQWLALKPDGPWGARIIAQRQALAQVGEARLREVEPAVAAALPLNKAGARSSPRLTGPPDPALIERAAGLLAFMAGTRASASRAGFAGLRAKVVEALEQRLAVYVEGLMEQLRAPAAAPYGGAADADAGLCVDPEWVRAYLEIAADFSGHVEGEAAAQIVRRRAAA